MQVDKVAMDRFKYWRRHWRGGMSLRLTLAHTSFLEESKERAEPLSSACVAIVLRSAH